MVEKKEDATMTCQNCNTDLICRTKDYGGDYAPKLQWQNFDGSAHYSTKDGKNFTCNIPEETPEESPTLEPKKEIDASIRSITAGPTHDELDMSTKKLVAKESTLLFKIKKEVESTIGDMEKDPHPGMVWQMTELIWKKHFGEKK